ncbi:Mitochondrial histidine--tRNA ligase [Lachnellula arida]|uniref:histidine--tRNA ligase n=1 Tax=Lachnellula arida TaxID=1316785 RepID=A0A8T9B1M7_9HELO|nr:Mitochondrial histidine--tRNA ligase [Lachnellula arida]
MSLDPKVPTGHGAMKADICECTEGFDNKPASATDTTRSLSLVSLPTDIHLLIFDELDAITSTCLAVTCKAFYPLHVAKWGLRMPIVSRLNGLLANWIGPDMLYDRWELMFVKKAYPGQTQDDFNVQNNMDQWMAANEAKMARSSVQLKTPKGTRDWFGSDLLLRDHILQTASNIFKLHGGTPLDTPAFELKAILAEKYGEDTRLMYDLADQGGELCSLRFDLTVPFARWLAMNNESQLKRYQIAKVYRRDQPSVAQGRLREFYQCDFDIAGVYDAMIADAEVLRVVVEVFEALGMGITIKVNHRRVLDGLFEVAGVPGEKIRSVSSAVDKLDKVAWAGVRREIVDEKGVSDEVADRVGEYVRRSGEMREMVRFLKSEPELCGNENIGAGIIDMELLVSYLEVYGVADKVSFDLSLARGLDYYTGLIFEVVNQPPGSNTAVIGKESESQVGSIAAGGRYDNLVGMYTRNPMPCVGISFGVDRIFTLLNALQGEKMLPGVDVYIIALSGKDVNGLLLERMSVARELWSAGISAEFTAKVKPRREKQSKESKNSRLSITLAPDEWAAGQVRLKDLRDDDTLQDKKDQGQLVSKENLIEEVKKLLST